MGRSLSQKTVPMGIKMGLRFKSWWWNRDLDSHLYVISFLNDAARVSSCSTVATLANPGASVSSCVLKAADSAVLRVTFKWSNLILQSSADLISWAMPISAPGLLWTVSMFYVCTGAESGCTGSETGTGWHAGSRATSEGSPNPHHPKAGWSGAAESVKSQRDAMMWSDINDLIALKCFTYMI